MENILSFDVSTEHARVTLTRVDGRVVEVVESKDFSRDILFAQVPEPTVAQAEFFSYVRSLVPQVQRTCVVAPQEDGFFLNLKLPFKDKKNIERVVPLEVQDSIPFELSEFILNSVSVNGAPVNGVPTPSSDVHVGAIPKTIVRRAIEICNSLQLEPALITTPASALGALTLLIQNYGASDCVFILETGNEIYLCLIHNSVPLNQRRIAISGDTTELVAEEIKLALRSFEATHNLKIQEIISVSSTRFTSKVASDLEIAYREVDLAGIIVPGGLRDLIALCAAFYTSEDAPIPLSNFRVGEFRYNRYTKEAILAAKKILPGFILLIIAFTFWLIGSYALQEFRISRLKKSVSESIRSNVPALVIPNAGNELPELTAEIARLDDQIRDLGSPSSINVLDALKELSVATDGIADIQIQRIRINGNTMRIEGRSPYATIDDLENKLRRHKGSFERVVTEQGSFSSNSNGDGRSSFAFKIILKE